MLVQKKMYFHKHESMSSIWTQNRVIFYLMRNNQIRQHFKNEQSLTYVGIARFNCKAQDLYPPNFLFE